MINTAVIPCTKAQRHKDTKAQRHNVDNSTHAAAGPPPSTDAPPQPHFPPSVALQGRIAADTTTAYGEGKGECGVRWAGKGGRCRWCGGLHRGRGTIGAFLLHIKGGLGRRCGPVLMPLQDPV
jgi:hypothetical protein